MVSLLLLQALLITGLASAQVKTPEIVLDPKVQKIDEEGAGKLYQVGDHKVLIMEGTPREMGYQHGRLLSTAVHHVITQGYMAKRLWDRGYTREYVLQQSARMEKFFPPEYVEELHGMVEGLKAAGVTDLEYDDVKLGVTQAEILHFDPNEAPQCSNFAVWGKWTPDGRLLHARNLDWDISGGAQEDAVIMIWRPKGGTPFMMVGWAGGIGSVSGMNAKGITLGEMTLPSPDATFDGMPLVLLMRRVLEKSSNLDDAVAILRDTPRTSGWNFVVGDAKAPDARALETDAVRCAVYAPMDEKEGDATGHWAMEDAVRRTNHPVGEEQLMKLAELVGPEMGITITELNLALPLLKVHNTYLRYDWLGKQIQAQPAKMDVQECMNLLVNGPVRTDVTLHSWVFDPNNALAYVSIAGKNPIVTACDMPYTRIDLKEWMAAE
jgi:predicted choloylglycine hydrolase